MARMPDSPSTITRRASAAVGPTRAMRRRPALTSARTHSAPLRVLPKPRRRQLFGPGAIAPIVLERVGFSRRQRTDQRVDLSFGQIGELFEQGGGHLFALLFFARPDPVDLVDQPLPRIVDQ